MTDLEWLHRISAADVTATAATRRVVETAAFQLLLDPSDMFFGINWATPLKASPNDLEIEAMRQAFRLHNRKPRLEFIAEVWPNLAPALERAGFTSEGAPQEIMLVKPENFTPQASADVRVGFLKPNDSDADVQVYLETQSNGFNYGAGGPPSAEEISRWRGQLTLGRRAALGWLEARAAGVGTTAGTELCELQGVATLPACRRRGVAATVSSALVRDAFDRGAAAVWLSVEDQGARACYAKLGFHTIGSRLNYSAD